MQSILYSYIDVLHHICSHTYIVMAIALNSENYPTLNDNIISIMMTGKYATISIFTDASGTIYAEDINGEIKDRVILSASYTASYIDPSGNTTNPFLVIKYKDPAGNPNGTFIDYFTATNYVVDHWYVLSEIPIPAFEF